MSFCVAVTRSTSVYDSSATFFEYLGSAITVASESHGSLYRSHSQERNRDDLRCSRLQYFLARSPSFHSQSFFFPSFFPSFQFVSSCDSSRRNCRYIKPHDVFLYMYVRMYVGMAVSRLLYALLRSFFR